MSIMMAMSLFLTMEIKIYTSPMTILIMLLIISWFLSMVYLMLGSEIWPLIYLIMLFNGGLMITYLFVVSMLPKEKKSSSFPFYFQSIILLLFADLLFKKGNSLMKEFLMSSMWILLILILLISFMSFFIFMVVMDPFKTMKSSF